MTDAQNLKIFLAGLRELFRLCFGPKPKVARFRFKFGEPQATAPIAPGEGEENMAASVNLTTALPYVRADIDPTTVLDEDGNQTTFAVPPTWGVNDDTLVDVTPDPDGMGCAFHKKGPLGTCTVTCSDDPDNDPSTAQIMATGTIVISAGAVAVFGINFGAPQATP